MITRRRLSNLEEKWKEERKSLSIWRHPILTLTTFLAASSLLIKKSALMTISHPIFLYLVLPSSVIWALFEQIPGPYTEAINLIEFSVQYVIWWVGLGILSSIGLGSGLQSGVLFLFPHIMKVCLAAQTCQSLGFESMSEIWFRNSENLFVCPKHDGDSPSVSFINIWLKVFPPSFLWATGTAIGEIPPYWMSKASRRAALDAGDEERDGVPEELESTSRYYWINRAKAWMIAFLQRHGEHRGHHVIRMTVCILIISLFALSCAWSCIFSLTFPFVPWYSRTMLGFFGVLMMASWPNLAFDLCGICCGHFQMPFWTFFGATFIGKAVVRNTYQTLFIVAMIRYGAL